MVPKHISDPYVKFGEIHNELQT